MAPKKPSQMKKTGKARPDPKVQQKKNLKALGKGLVRNAGEDLLANAKKRQKVLDQVK